MSSLFLVILALFSAYAGHVLAVGYDWPDIEFAIIYTFAIFNFGTLGALLHKGVLNKIWKSENKAN